MFHVKQRVVFHVKPRFTLLPAALILGLLQSAIS
jgi:hypothetical protein